MSRLVHLLLANVREAQRSALRGGPVTQVPPLDVRYEKNAAGGAHIRALLAQLAAGNGGPDALQALRGQSAALAQLGLTEGHL
ncbi:MAG: hypothetical protein GKR94_09470 [Gammaproteobacteria bacterium]|nr:hypothetical protein [Gammaproteobacteria bacterium]